MIIAIDGPAGAGKSTVARKVAAALGLVYLDTGAMYRAVTLEVLRRGVEPGSEEACARVANELQLGFDVAGRVLIDGLAGEPAIRGEDVTRSVSQVSAHPDVRKAIVVLQRALGEDARGPEGRRGLVAEGRDTTTVVFPDATHKFFLIATAEERARRRAAELGRPEQFAEVLADIERRDTHDSSRATSPLRQAPDAAVVDTTGLRIDGVAQTILQHVRDSEGCVPGGDDGR